MCRRAKSDAAGDGVGDMEETADGFADDISENPGRDDGGDGDGDIAAELFGKSHADGRGDGLWKQRHVGSVVKAEGQASEEFCNRPSVLRSERLRADRRSFSAEGIS